MSIEIPPIKIQDSRYSLILEESLISLSFDSLEKNFQTKLENKKNGRARQMLA